MPMDHNMHKSMQLANVVNFNQPRYHKYQYEEHATPRKTVVIEPGVNELYYRLKDKVHKQDEATTGMLPNENQKEPLIGKEKVEYENLVRNS